MFRAVNYDVNKDIKSSIDPILKQLNSCEPQTNLTTDFSITSKFASNFYGPFRAIANSSPAFGDRRGYQLDCKDLQAALDKVKEDIEGGADIVMVKPAIGYLDVVSKVKGRFDKPLAVYNVSGEYAFVKQGMRSGLWNEREVVSEIFSSFKRAGADLIITYHAKDIALWQNRQ